MGQAAGWGRWARGHKPYLPIHLPHLPYSITRDGLKAGPYSIPREGLKAVAYSMAGRVSPGISNSRCAHHGAIPLDITRS